MPRKRMYGQTFYNREVDQRTEEEKQLVPMKCDLCYYQGRIENKLCCDYILITGKARGFDPITKEKKDIPEGMCDSYKYDRNHSKKERGSTTNVEFK